jgi:hypothetical protein
MSIIGDARPEHEFQFENFPGNLAQAAFVAIVDGGAVVTRRATDLFELPDDCPVVANWHGQRRTDAFATTVGYLKKLGAEYRR